MVYLLFLFLSFVSFDFAQAVAYSNEVDILLVLAVDVSDSVDNNEYQLQKKGIVAALQDENLKMILEQCNELGVGITYLEWSGHQNLPNQSAQMVPWTHVKSGQDLQAFAEKVSKVSRLTRAATDIELALVSSEQLIEKQSPFFSENKVILVSGDGTTNTSSLNSMISILPAQDAQEKLDRSLLLVRNRLVSKGYTIHGVIVSNYIENNRTITVEEYFSKYVIGGNNAFSRAVKDFSEYSDGLLDVLIHTLNKCVS